MGGGEVLEMGGDHGICHLVDALEEGSACGV